MKLRHFRGSLLLAWAFGLSPFTGKAAESCDPVRTFADGRQPLREIFVSPGGNNVTGNGTRSSPYRDLARALKGVSPGDAIRLLPGIHGAGNSVGSIAGTSNAPIWIGGVPGEARPEIHGGTAALLLSRVRYLVVENLVVAGATQNGVNCDDGGDYANPDATRHLLFRNLEIRDIGTGGNHDGLKLSGVNDYQVLDCTFTRMSSGGSGIDHVGCHRGLIARCSFTDMGSNAIQCKGGSEDIEIRANRFLNGGGRAINIGGSTGFPFFRPPLSTVEPNAEARNIRVFANLFRGSDAPLAFVGAVDCVAAQNTIVEPRRWVIRILQETVTGSGYTFHPCGSNRFVNNLVVVRRAQVGTHVNVGGNTDAASFRFERNLWYASDRPSQSRPTLPTAESGGVYGLDPQFRDAPSGNFSVPAASPAVARGLSLPAPRADLLQRCYAEVPTLGAFEAIPRPFPSADTDGDHMPDGWESAHGLDPRNPADAREDPDADGWVNFGEFLAGTDPRDNASCFSLTEARLADEWFTFRYATIPGRIYRVLAREWAGAVSWNEVSALYGTGGLVEFREAGQYPGRLFRVSIDLADAGELPGP